MLRAFVVFGRVEDVADALQVRLAVPVQTEAGFGGEHFDDALVQALAGDPPFLNGLHDAADGLFGILGHEQDIGAGLDRGGGGLGGSEELSQAPHIHRVGDDEAGEFQFFF